jgi:glycine/D-amino acid oxidase-like deaminating enzyme
MSDRNTRTYIDDECPPHEKTPKRALLMRVSGGDYFIQTVQEGVRAGIDDPEPAEFIKYPEYGALVRIRTSGSSDPRNARVCNALRELWEALGDAKPRASQEEIDRVLESEAWS